MDGSSTTRERKPLSGAERARRYRARIRAQGGERRRIYLANERFRKRWARREAWNARQFRDLDTEAILFGQNSRYGHSGTDKEEVLPPQRDSESKPRAARRDRGARGVKVPWWTRGGRLRWLPCWLSWETIRSRVGRELSPGERERVERLRREHSADLERGPGSRPGSRSGPPRWADGRPIRARVEYGDPRPDFRGLGEVLDFLRVKRYSIRAWRR